MSLTRYSSGPARHNTPPPEYSAGISAVRYKPLEGDFSHTLDALDASRYRRPR